FTLDERPHELPSARRRELRRDAEQAGITIGALHWLLVTPEGLSITSADAAVRSRTLDVMRGLIELCAELGGTVLVHGSPQQRRLPEAEKPAAAARERAIDAFAKAAERARAANVTYCIEPLSRHEANFITSVAEAATIVDHLGSSHLRTMIDCRAARLGEPTSVPALLREWVPGGMIGHVHLNDSNSRAPGQ